MNLTLSLDEKLAQRARQVAQSMDKSLNQLVREYLEQLTRMDDAEADMEELRRLSGTGHSGGKKFDRASLYDRA
jgi:uncharacterized protein YhaN